MHNKEFTEPVCTIEASDKSFDYWKNREDTTPELREGIAAANMLIVPSESYRDFREPTFPTGTEELLEYLRENSPPELTPEIYATDTTYQELALHADILRIATLVVEFGIVPLAIGLLSNYLYSRLGSRRDNTTVIFDMHITGHRQTAKVHYEGPAPAFEASIKKALETLQANPDAALQQSKPIVKSNDPHGH
ncbi:MAG TPA: hypothetical protein VFZ09_47985 [Archangium sp.]|uniref:hypothetical protein n=1 Tax=Archangium sp. TaxID=1872627 RepID=UPI002E32E3EF|nr:hypothetical protein [Archangium sp.]HEX5754017.1 hypothetical protein [Archangium sp.]